MTGPSVAEPVLHPQAAEALKLIDSLSTPFSWAADATEAVKVDIARKAHIAVSPALVGPRAPVAASIDVPPESGPGVRVRISVPSPRVPGIIVYLHGGGWVIGTLDTFDGVCRQLALRTEMPVVSVDYRLAPEHPYPAAIDDAEAVVRWVAEGQAPGVPAGSPIFVVGDSAGGNLAASVCLRCRDSGGPQIAGQVLVYPITDVTMGSPSYPAFGEGLYLTEAAMNWYWESYLQARRADGRHDASVLHARLGALPPGLVITAEMDPLRDEGEAYAYRLGESGTSVQIRRFDGMMHGFWRFGGVIDAAGEALDEAATFITAVASRSTTI